jgi:hypothetical protein
MRGIRDVMDLGDETGFAGERFRLRPLEDFARNEFSAPVFASRWMDR